LIRGAARAPLVLTESRSLAGVLRHIVQDYCARIAATNGQCGGFLHTDVMPALHASNVVLYLGDFDVGQPDRGQHPRVLEREMGRLRWERLALTREQVDAHDLPVIIKRDRRYKDGRPHEAVETEAISQMVLTTILRGRLNEVLPEPLAHVQERAERQRRRVAAALRKMR
jgi:hypothetical protein